MSGSDLTQNAREIITSYSRGDWNNLKNLLTPDAVYNEIGTQRRIQGPDQIVRTLQDWKKAMTDSSGSVTHSLASGNRVVLELTWQGTHNGPFSGPAGTLSPTGRRQTTPAVMIVTFQGDKVKEVNHYFDMLSFLQQIGAMPSTTRA
ncbi:MAG TPA: ester cyclase [Terriglobales bacterium]|nr:ester cyclase [Terriglobales bacterium]